MFSLWINVILQTLFLALDFRDLRIRLLKCHGLVTFESCRRAGFLKFSRLCRLLPKTNNIFQFHIFIVRPTLTNFGCSHGDSETLFVCKMWYMKITLFFFTNLLKQTCACLKFIWVQFFFYICVVRSLFGITFIRYYIKGYGYILLDSRTFS